MASDSEDETSPLGPPARRLCWCTAELGFDTVYSATHLARHSGILTQQRRVKAVLILSAMELRVCASVGPRVCMYVCVSMLFI